MKYKGNILLTLILIVIMCAITTVALTACDNNGNEDNNTHIHSYSDEWTSDDVYHWHAATCGHDVVDGKAEHNWDGGVVTKEPTCTEKGEKVYTCTVCDKTKIEEIAPNGHTFFDEWTSDNAYHWHAATCNHDVVDGKAEHSWDGGVVTKEPTCTEKGEKVYTCTVCDKTKIEEIAPNGHTFSDEWTSDDAYHWHAATCGHDVVSDKAEHNGNPCTVCGHESIPEHEHSLEHHAAEPVTCTENGNIEYWECSGCHKYFSDEQGETEITDKNSVIIVAEGHTWENWETVKQATCTEDGKQERRCSVCNKIEYETIPTFNHNYGNWQTVKEPTCTEEGEKQRICSLCSHIDSETIPVIAHTYEGYSKNAEYHWQVCSVCQHNTENEAHNFIDGVCSVCNYDSRYSFELDFKLTGDYYTVTGLGNCTDKEINIPEIYEGKPVKAIAANAFWGKTDITSFNIPKSIESIGNNAFQNCTGLEKISIENKRVELGSGSFLGCEKISWASLPAFIVSEITVTNLKNLIVTEGELENAVLTDAKNLVSLTAPDILTTLGAVFGTNTSVLESLTLAETTEIAENAFKDFTALKEINLPEGIDYIGADAFLNTAYYNDNSNWVFNVLYLDNYLLKSNIQIEGHYPINNNTTVIADSAFSGCSGLTSITVPDSVTSIGEYAFNGCNGLTSITVPFVGEKADGSGNNYFGYIFGASSYSDNKNYVPASLKEVIITGGASIGERAFYNCSGLTSITILDSVTSIGSSAFSGCSGLTSITIPDGVTSIGNNAFNGCSGLTSLTVPDSVTSIGERAFYYCSGLTSITIPFVGEKADGSGNNYFGYIFGASSYSSNENYVPASLKEVIITGGASIGERAFYNCNGLTSITIPDSVTSIGEYTFYNCSGLTSITIPGSVTSIGSSAFYNCRRLTSMTIPDSVTSIGSYAFSDCSGLTSMTIPDSVTSIGSYAFSDCSGLTSMTIPDSVTSIGSYAFRGCSGLTSITIPDSVTSIGEYTFYNCSGLTSITIPDGVTSIGNNAFNGCSGLTSLTVPDSVTSIGDYAFLGCNGLTSITVPFVGEKADGSGNNYFGYIFGASSYSDNKNYVPASLKEVIITGGASIGNDAFYYCSGLTSITIPDSVTSIGSWAFSGCSGLTSIIVKEGNTKYHSSGNCLIETESKTIILGLQNSIIPIDGSVTSIGNDAFYKCSGLTSISVPDGITSIGSSAFSGCSGLTSITVPDSVTSIGSYAFSDCSGLTSITIPFVGKKADGSGNNYFGYIFGASSYGYNKNYVPASLKEVIITGGASIGEVAFYGCSGLTSITIPDSVTSIGSYAFSDCSGLTSITIPDGVTSIGSSAFSDCSGLTSITIPDGVTSIGEYTFYNCSGLTSISVPDSVTSIGSSAFRGCRRLTSITVPFVGEKADGSGNNYFGYIFGASSYNSNENYVPASLKEVIITGGASIGERAFYYCSGLTSITIPDSVTSIGNYAFSGCSGLTSLTIPDGVTSIGEYTFYNCSGLTSITIPDSVTSIGSYAFRGCSGLTSITIPDSVTSIGDYAFSGCSGLTSISVPDGATSIGEYAFNGCSGLTSITIPDSLTSIGSSAFRGCSGLTSITIPDSVTSIGDYAFSGCLSLTIYCEAKSKPSGWSVYWNPEDRPVVWEYQNQ